jgi:hypothetical protein
LLFAIIDGDAARLGASTAEPANEREADDSASILQMKAERICGLEMRSVKV